MKMANTIPYAKIWVVLSVYLNVGGWGLSALGHLDAWGYGLLLAAGVPLFFWLFKQDLASLELGYSAKLKCRFRRFFPAFFLFLLVAAFIGGALYPPNNYDALTYRIPRVLRWLSEKHWHWIEVIDGRMNWSAVGFEWLMTPLFAFTHSERFFFLINIASYALLPGLTYATAIRLGISRRVAWYWMWLLPTGYCFASQAGSIGNDAFAAVYFLAALFFTLRARETRSLSDLLLGGLSVALLTAAKGSNLPLLLPWLLLALPLAGLVRKNLLATAAVACLALLSSFFALAVLNTRYAGTWTGVRSNNSHLQIENPVYGLWGNGLQLFAQNAMLPVMPFPDLWNRQVDRFLQTEAGKDLLNNFRRLDLQCGELLGEEAAGIGLGLSMLLGLSLVGGWARRAPIKAGNGLSRFLQPGVMVCAGGWIAILVYMAKMGSGCAARICAPFYIVVILSVLLLPGMSALVRRRWWRVCAALAALSVLPTVVLHPSRPLWPALTVCDLAAEKFPNSRLVERARTVYAVYRQRADGLAPVRKYLPQGDKVVGFLGADDTEVALWRPYGERKIVGVMPGNLHLFAEKGWPMVIREEGINVAFNQSMEEWLRTTGATVIGKETILQKISQGEREWYVVKVKNGGPANIKP